MTCPGSRIARLLTAAFVAMACLVLPLAVPAANAVASPAATFSATSVCINGQPEIAFTGSGFSTPTDVILIVYDSPLQSGSHAAVMGPGSPTWLYTLSPPMNTGSPFVGAELNSSPSRNSSPLQIL